MAVNFRGRLANLSEVGRISVSAVLVAHVCLCLYVVFLCPLAALGLSVVRLFEYACVWKTYIGPA